MAKRAKPQDGSANGDTNERIEWEDASEKSSGLIDRVLGNGDEANQNGGSAVSASATSESTSGDTTAESAGNEEAARSDEAQALVRSILNGLQEPTIVVDTDGQITHINEQALELYDCQESEAVGTVPHALQADASPGHRWHRVPRSRARTDPKTPVYSLYQ